MPKFKTINAIIVDFDKFVRNAHIDLATALIEDVRTDSRSVSREYGSPVASGRFSASVRGEIGGAGALGRSADQPADPNYVWDLPRTIPLPPIERLRARLKAFRVGQKIQVGNTLDYATDIEAGRSRKTPRGVYRVTTERFKRRMRALAAESAMLRSATL